MFESHYPLMCRALQKIKAKPESSRPAHSLILYSHTLLIHCIWKKKKKNAGKRHPDINFIRPIYCVLHFFYLSLSDYLVGLHQQPFWFYFFPFHCQLEGFGMLHCTKNKSSHCAFRFIFFLFFNNSTKKKNQTCT